MAQPTMKDRVIQWEKDVTKMQMDAQKRAQDLGPEKGNKVLLEAMQEIDAKWRGRFKPEEKAEFRKVRKSLHEDGWDPVADYKKNWEPLLQKKPLAPQDAPGRPQQDEDDSEGDHEYREAPEGKHEGLGIMIHIVGLPEEAGHASTASHARMMAAKKMMTPKGGAR